MHYAVCFGLREKVMAGEEIVKLVIGFIKPQSIQSPRCNRQVRDVNLT
jgi:hypothetical protein